MVLDSAYADVDLLEVWNHPTEHFPLPEAQSSLTINIQGLNLSP